MWGATSHCQVTEGGPHFIPGHLPIVCVAHGSRSHWCRTDNSPIAIARRKEVGRTDVVLRSINSDVHVPPIHFGDLTANNGDFAWRITPDGIVSGSQCEKESCENWTPVGSAFQDIGVALLPIIALWANIDLLAAKLFPCIDDQSSNVLPDVKHRMFGVNSFNILLNHVLCSLCLSL